MARIWTVLAVAFLASGGALPAPILAQSSGVPRVVAIGDIHGDADAFRGILRDAAIIDENGRWIAGRTTLVQTGDFTDRGAKVRAAMDLLIDLEQQATAAGGRVAVLLGNHEVMNLLGDGRDVTPAIYAAFADDKSARRRDGAYEAYVRLLNARHLELGRSIPGVTQPVSKDDWMSTHPVGFVEYREALGPRGRYGRWLRTKPVVLRVGDTVFLHAGIDPATAPRSLDDINKQVLGELKRFDDYRSRMVDRRLILPFASLTEMLTAAQVEVALDELRARSSERPGAVAAADQLPDPLGLKSLLGIDRWAVSAAEGPLWFRGFATWPSDAGAIHMPNLLQRYGVSHFVVGHTITQTRRITPRFSGAVFLIDTGMLSSYVPGGIASALEISGGRFTAIHGTDRTVLLERPQGVR
jgi:hypothetical protein